MRIQVPCHREERTDVVETRAGCSEIEAAPRLPRFDPNDSPGTLHTRLCVVTFPRRNDCGGTDAPRALAVLGVSLPVVHLNAVTR